VWNQCIQAGYRWHHDEELKAIEDIAKEALKKLGITELS
jgi:hypothetical protein